MFLVWGSLVCTEAGLWTPSSSWLLKWAPGTAGSNCRLPPGLKIDLKNSLQACWLTVLGHLFASAQGASS